MVSFSKCPLGWWGPTKWHLGVILACRQQKEMAHKFLSRSKPNAPIIALKHCIAVHSPKGDRPSIDFENRCWLVHLFVHRKLATLVRPSVVGADLGPPTTRGSLL